MSAIGHYANHEAESGLKVRRTFCSPDADSPSRVLRSAIFPLRIGLIFWFFCIKAKEQEKRFIFLPPKINLFQ